MISFKTILGSLFAALVVTIVVLGVVSYQNNQQVTRASLFVSHTHEVIEKTEEVSSAYKDARLAINRMIITADSSDRESYHAAMAALSIGIQQLMNLTSDDSARQLSIDSIKYQIREFQLLADSIVSLIQARAPSETVHNVFVSGKLLRDELTRRIDSMREAEMVLLAERQAASRTGTAAFTRTFIFMLIGMAILLVAVFLVVRYNFNKRIRIEQELKRSRLLFEKIFYESPIAIVISDIDTGEIVNCNKVFANTVNFSFRELIGKSATELKIFENQEVRDELVSGARRNGKGRGIEVYIQPRDREKMYVSIHSDVIPLYDRKCLLTAILDLSTHKRAEDEIKNALNAEKELNRLKSNFVTLASHEFRTPLTTILSSTFLLEKYGFGENQDKALKHLTRIKSSVNNLTSILDEFLSVTKIEEGHVEPTIEHVDLPKYLSGICSNLQAFAKPGQVIRYKHHGELDVNTDPVLLANILNNLVTNSIKYSGENSIIQVTSSVNSKFHLSVKDDGIGIPKEDQKNLFERFYRASNAGAVQGTGLGLHIMKHYVEMLRGKIDLSSEQGKGTEISVTFDRD
jgi:PAS domain S-box-containing protein